jgi:hypothetical protein
MIRWDNLLNTLWEDMTIKKARSLNHKMFATPLGWMTRYHSNWHVNGDGVIYDITIPPNSSATLRLPLLGKSLVSVSESGKEIRKDGKTIGTIAGGKDGHLEQQEFIIALGSGNYSFQVKTK